MTTVDILVLISIVLPAILGVIFGFVSMSISLVSWILSLIISWNGATYLTQISSANSSDNILSSPEILVNFAIAFVGLFFASLLVFSILSRLISKLLERESSLSAMNRLLGGCLGSILGMFMTTIWVFLAGFTSYPEIDEWQESMLVRPFESISQSGQRFLPDTLIVHHHYS